MADGVAREGEQLQSETVGEVSTCKIKTLIQNLQKNMNENFTALSTDVTKLMNRMQITEENTKKIESDITTLNRAIWAT
jgi:hypothetical protein